MKKHLTQYLDVTLVHAPKRNAAEYARNPEKIANYVYQDEFRKYKMGNTKKVMVGVPWAWTKATYWS